MHVDTAVMKRREREPRYPGPSRCAAQRREKSGGVGRFFQEIRGHPEIIDKAFVFAWPWRPDPAAVTGRTDAPSPAP